MTDILEKTSDGFFALDTDWNFTYLNAEAEVILDNRGRHSSGKISGNNFPA